MNENSMKANSHQQSCKTYIIKPAHVNKITPIFTKRTFSLFQLFLMELHFYCLSNIILLLIRIFQVEVCKLNQFTLFSEAIFQILIFPQKTTYFNLTSPQSLNFK